MFTARRIELGCEHIRPIPIGFELPEIDPPPARGRGVAIAYHGGYYVPLLEEEFGQSHTALSFSVMSKDTGRAFFTFI